MQKLKRFSCLKRIKTNFRKKIECWKAPRYSDNISEWGKILNCRSQVEGKIIGTQLMIDGTPIKIDCLFPPLKEERELRNKEMLLKFYLQVSKSLSKSFVKI